MKILYTTYALANMGGVERILTDKMNWLAENTDYDIHLATWDQNSAPTPFHLSEKVTMHDLNIKTFSMYRHNKLIRPFYRWNALKSLHKEMQEFVNNLNPDIMIIIGSYFPDVTSTINTTAIKIVESHCAKSQIGHHNESRHIWLEEKLLERSIKKTLRTVEKNVDCIVAITNDDAKEWKHSNVKVVPNMIQKHSNRIKNNATQTVIAVGRLEYQKGFDTMLDIWHIVHKSHPDWILDIYGEGSMKENLLAKITNYGLQDVVNIKENTPSIIERMTECSIFAFPSRYEGFGLALAEAMSCGLPAVSFNCPYGPADIITDGEDGFLVKQGDCDSFAAKIIYLIEHPEERKRMGQNGIESTKRFSAEKIMPLWINLFHQLINIDS